MLNNIPNFTDLTGKVIVITGAGGVLCAAFARAVASCGAKVALLDWKLDAVQEVAEEIGKNAKPYVANVLIREELEQARDAILKDFGTCDILINGAGGNSPQATTTKEYFSLEDWENKNDDLVHFFDLDKEGISYVFDLNFMGTLIPTQVFTKDMIDKKGCSIINISSMNAFTPLTKIPAYSGAKAAVSNFTQWLAVHFSKVGIRVNAIAPGFFVTKQNEKMLFDESGNPTERTEKILAATPMERFGKPEELIGTLLYLLSDSGAGFVTGIVIPVDGGFSAYSGV